MGVMVNEMRYVNMLGTQVPNVSFLFLWGSSKEGKNEKQERRGEKLRLGEAYSIILQ